MPRNQLIQVRRSPSTGAGSWSAINPVLGDGEFGFESNTRKVKVGDGVTTWNLLPYIGVGASDTSTTSTNLTGGLAGSIPVQTSPGVTAFLNIGAVGKLLQVDPTTGLPAWNLPKFTDFAASNSDALRGLISDSTGTGSAVFGTSPTLVTPKVSAGGSVHAQVSGTNATTFVAAAGAASTLTFPAVTDTVVVQGNLTPYFKVDGTGNFLDLGNRGILFNSTAQLALPGVSGTLALTTIVNGYVKADGSTLITGALNMNGNAIFGVTNLTLTGTLTTGMSAGLVRAGAGGTLTGGNLASLTTDVAGTLPVANGGTGGTDVATARAGLRIFVQSAQPSSANIPGYTPQPNDIWLW